MNMSVDKDKVFNHKYYYYLYSLNLRSIIGNCKVDKFDALNGNGCEYKLNEIYAYLEVYADNKELFPANVKELKHLFKEAVALFTYRYVQQTEFLPANYDCYTDLINSWNLKED